MQTVKKNGSPNLRTVVSQNLVRLMKANNKSRKQLCEDIDVKYTTLCDWINGKSLPKLETLETLSFYFGTEVTDFFVEFDGKSAPSARLTKYMQTAKELSMSSVENFSDDTINELLKNGFVFKHRSLEEYATQNGGKLNLDGEYDWKTEEIGREIWQ